MYTFNSQYMILLYILVINLPYFLSVRLHSWLERRFMSALVYLCGAQSHRASCSVGVLWILQLQEVRDMRQITFVHVVLCLIMRGSLSPLVYTTLWRCE